MPYIFFAARLEISKNHGTINFNGIEPGGIEKLYLQKIYMKNRHKVQFCLWRKVNKHILEKMGNLKINVCICISTVYLHHHAVNWP